MSYNKSDLIEKDKDCQLNPPWAMIIMMITGGILLVYTTLGENIDSNVKIFGILMIVLWTLMWSFILYLLWKDNYITSTWWMLVLGISALIFFFILIIILNVDKSI